LSAGGPYPTIQSTSLPSLSTNSSVGVALILNRSKIVSPILSPRVAR